VAMGGHGGGMQREAGWSVGERVGHGASPLHDRDTAGAARAYSAAMAYWLTVYCRKPVSSLSPAQLLAGIRDQDPAAPAGVDYWTVAEDFGIEDEAVVDAALDVLHVRPEGATGLDGLEVGYRSEAEARPIVVHCWSDPERVAEEIREAEENRSPPPRVRERLRASTEVVGLELGFSQLEDMGIVIANELARWLAQKGDGVVADDDDGWMAVRGGGWVEP